MGAGKNTKAIAFYQRHGFQMTGQKKFEKGTTEYIVELKRVKDCIDRQGM